MSNLTLIVNQARLAKICIYGSKNTHGGKGLELGSYVLCVLFECIAAHSDYCGSMNVKEFYREDSHLGLNEESICKCNA